MTEVGQNSYLGIKLTNSKCFQVGLGLFGEPYLLIRTTWVEERKFELIKGDFAPAKDRCFIQLWKDRGIESWEDKRDHDGLVVGDGVGKTVLCEKFETIWPTLEEEFP